MSNQVDDHRNMLMLTKSISAFQEENLKKWPYVFFDDVEKVDINWDFLDKSQDFSPGSVDFDIELKNDDKIDEGVDTLILCTKFLFWKETEVSVTINGKLWENKLQKELTTSQNQKEKS
jgi:hypothetical protein